VCQELTSVSSGCCISTFIRIWALSSFILFVIALHAALQLWLNDSYTAASPSERDKAWAWAFTVSAPVAAISTLGYLTVVITREPTAQQHTR
jgi:hypothetical protein